ncbi:MAG: 5-(carboxyamino)imidazole ribonucleotide synthase [Holosporaceae bacterium]|jgi:5-(carboxyamino)imidazole ribonucleotide synthase
MSYQATNQKLILPGATIGIIGGGQLGRLTALAAAAMGYKTHIYTPDADSPASQVATMTTVGGFENFAALEAFADQVDVATFEFENIPADCVEQIASRTPVRPWPSILEIAQNRLREKDFLRSLAIPTAPYACVCSAAELKAALKDIGLPAILKTNRMGYDGKGQVRLDLHTNLEDAWARLQTSEAILEGFVELATEISVIVARNIDGETLCYPIAENKHQNQILVETIAPARILPKLAEEAFQMAEQIASATDLVGILAVEMFVTLDGRLLVNELAPRPHNSGHWTLDACTTSQFEQLVRAICGLPLGEVRVHSRAIMRNLIGVGEERWQHLFFEKDAKVYLYGKSEVLPDRKMGHVTWLSPLEEELVITSVDHHNPPPVANPSVASPVANVLPGSLPNPSASNVTPFIKRV